MQEASISIPPTSTARSSSEVEKTRQGDAAIRKVHFILNSKGGLGKSFVAFLLSLYYRHLHEPVLCFDADATTATFS
jgi:Mrp family chromosome partitioning ATPase